MANPLSLEWHNLPISEVKKSLDSDPEKGLSLHEVETRRERYGPNELEAGKKASALKIFLSQFNDIMIWVLAAAAIISGFVLKELLDAVAIMAILVLNSILGFVQEFRAEKAMEALRKLAAPTAKAIRDGKEEIIPSRDIVPGDLIRLETGDSVPADARLVQCQVFSSQEAALTGESQPVNKTTAEMPSREVPLADRKNMVYAGTLVASGRALALVTATGPSSEMGQIAALLDTKDEKTPLQYELRDVGKKITFLCLAVAAVVIVAGIARGHSIAIMFLAGVSLAVAAIPEGLPAVITVSLALGVQNMAKHHAVIRKLHAVETLGSTSVICSDKTGTLTQNKMAVRRIFFQNRLWKLSAENKLLDPESNQETDLDLVPLLKVAVLCNDARQIANGKMLGDPTETALVFIGEAFGLNKDQLEKEMPRISEVPFDSDRKRMSTIHRPDGSFLVLMKGAPEQVLPHCSRLLLDSEHEMTAKDRDTILGFDGQLAREGFRNLAFAYKEMKQAPKETSSDEVESDLVFAGLLGLTDPPRPEVAQAIETCKKAHINVAMITGDHKLTAEAIAREIGLLDGRKIITGIELEKMPLEQLEKELADIAVFARVSPKDKIKIVKAYRDKGYVVGMTGDGINDAPAVKMADIGISMGEVGTDVTREASDLVLADDNFATIVEAVREGRTIFDNLRKFILFLLSCNISEVGTVFLAMVLGFPLPLFPVQILWINLVTDGLPALALGVDPPDPDLMERPPRSSTEGILSRARQKQVVWQGLVLTAGAISSFLLSYLWLGDSLGTSRTVVFTTLVFVQLLHALSFRSERQSILAMSSLANRYLIAAIVGSVLLQVAVIYLPFVRPVFRTLPLGWSEWAVIGVSCLSPILIVDLIKTQLARAKS